MFRIRSNVQANVQVKCSGECLGSESGPVFANVATESCPSPKNKVQEAEQNEDQEKEQEAAGRTW